MLGNGLARDPKREHGTQRSRSTFGQGSRFSIQGYVRCAFASHFLCNVNPKVPTFYNQLNCSNLTYAQDTQGFLSIHRGLVEVHCELRIKSAVLFIEARVGLPAGPPWYRCQLCSGPQDTHTPAKPGMHPTSSNTTTSLTYKRKPLL